MPELAFAAPSTTNSLAPSAATSMPSLKDCDGVETEKLLFDSHLKQASQIESKRTSEKNATTPKESPISEKALDTKVDSEGSNPSEPIFAKSDQEDQHLSTNRDLEASIEKQNKTTTPSSAQLNNKSGNDETVPHEIKKRENIFTESKETTIEEDIITGAQQHNSNEKERGYTETEIKNSNTQHPGSDLEASIEKQNKTTTPSSVQLNNKSGNDETVPHEIEKKEDIIADAQQHNSDEKLKKQQTPKLNATEESSSEQNVVKDATDQSHDTSTGINPKQLIQYPEQKNAFKAKNPAQPKPAQQSTTIKSTESTTESSTTEEEAVELLSRQVQKRSINTTNILTKRPLSIAEQYNNGSLDYSTKKTDLILNKIQRIINTSNETGSVSLAVTQTEIKTEMSIKNMQQISVKTENEFEHNQTTQIFHMLEGTQKLTKEQKNGIVSAQRSSGERSTFFSENKWNTPEPTLLQKEQLSDKVFRVNQDIDSPRTPEEPREPRSFFAEEKTLLRQRNNSTRNTEQIVFQKNISVQSELTGLQKQIQDSLFSGKGRQAVKQLPADQYFMAEYSKNVSFTAEGNLFSSETTTSTLFSSQYENIEGVEMGNAPLQTITLPSGRVVREQEVVRQFLDKFQINGRNLESKINIKLNPAELGEIKINLTVKEGAIKANVIAQSQVTQTILERNLDKLKSILEIEGFDVDEINIQTSSEASTEFDLLEERQSEHGEATHSSPKRTAAVNQSNEKELKEEHKSSQVNLRV